MNKLILCLFFAAMLMCVVARSAKRNAADLSSSNDEEPGLFDRQLGPRQLEQTDENDGTDEQDQLWKRATSKNATRTDSSSSSSEDDGFWFF